MTQQIRDYTAETAAGGIQDVPQARNYFDGGVGDALAGAGESVSRLSQVLKQRNTQAEIAKVEAQTAAAHAQLTIEQQQDFQSADPNDREVADRFMEKYDSRMATIGNEIQSPAAQRHFQVANASQRAQFLVDGYKTQARLAGVAAQQNFTSATDSWSTQVLNNPNAFETTKTQLGNLVESMQKAGSIDANTADKLQANGEFQLAEANFRGIANGNPDAARKMLADGHWDEYFNADQKLQASGFIDTVERSREARSSMLDRQAKEALKQLQDSHMDGYLKAWQTPTSDPTKLLAQITNDPVLSPSQKLEYIGIAQRDPQKASTRDDTYMQVLRGIDAKDGEVGKIYSRTDIDRLVGRGLSRTDAEHLRNEFVGRQNPDNAVETKVKTDFLAAAKEKLKANGLNATADSLQNNAQFSRDFLPAYEEARKAGKPWQELLDSNNPESLFSKTLNRYVTNSRTKDLMSVTMGPQDTPAQDVMAEGKRYRVKKGAVQSSPGKYKRADLEEIK